MRPRAGTHPVTLEPTRVVEILSLARVHDEKLQETRQDLFRAETKLNFERAWRWPIRAACVGLGAVGMAAGQNDNVRAGAVDLFYSVFDQARDRGVEALVSLLVIGAAAWLMIFLVRRWLRGPTPERQARKLMEEFARADGVASYVFAGQNNPDEEAANIGALTRPENKHFRQRRLTQDNRPLASSLMQLLNRQVDHRGQLQQREPELELTQPITRVERA
jgi:hypothetical protein